MDPIKEAEATQEAILTEEAQMESYVEGRHQLFDSGISAPTRLIHTDEKKPAEPEPVAVLVGVKGDSNAVENSTPRRRCSFWILLSLLGLMAIGIIIIGTLAAKNVIGDNSSDDKRSSPDYDYHGDVDITDRRYDIQFQWQAIGRRHSEEEEIAYWTNEFSYNDNGRSGISGADQTTSSDGSGSLHSSYTVKVMDSDLPDEKVFDITIAFNDCCTVHWRENINLLEEYAMHGLWRPWYSIQPCQC